MTPTCTKLLLLVATLLVSQYGRLIDAADCTSSQVAVGSACAEWWYFLVAVLVVIVIIVSSRASVVAAAAASSAHAANVSKICYAAAKTTTDADCVMLPWDYRTTDIVPADYGRPTVPRPFACKL